MASQWAAKSDTYDMVVGDSQWVGQGATQGHYVDLTEFMKSQCHRHQRNRSHHEILR